MQGCKICLLHWRNFWCLGVLVADTFESGEVNFKLCLHWPFEWLRRLAPSEGQWEGADDTTLCWLVGPCASQCLSWARFQMLWFGLLKQGLPVEVAYVCRPTLLSWSKKSIQELGFRPVTAWEKFSFSSCIFTCSLSLTSSWKSTGVSLAFEDVSRLIQTYNLKLGILLLAVAWSDFQNPPVNLIMLTPYLFCFLVHW